MLKKLFKLIPIFAVMLCVLAVFASAATISIGNASELAALMADSSKWAYDITITEDITLTNEAQAPIGNSTTMFTGTIDGGNHTISGINLSGATNVGFIGVCGNASIKNLTLKGTVTATGNYAAGFIACPKGDIVIENCTNNVAVSGTSYVGGISGGNLTVEFSLAIKNCTNNAKITGADAGERVGGIVGCISSSKQGNLMVIESSVNNGDVVGGALVGGIVGRWEIGSANTITGHKISDCANHGNITGKATPSTGTLVGGIAGIFTSTNGYSDVIGCYNEGTITAAGKYAGGIVGLYRANKANRSGITDCMNVGNVSSKVNGGVAGGIIGSANTWYAHTVSNCYNTGVVTTADNTVVGPIAAAFLSTSTYENLYYVQNATVNAPYAGIDKATAVTADTTFESFAADKWIVVNNTPELKAFHIHNYAKDALVPSDNAYYVYTCKCGDSYNKYLEKATATANYGISVTIETDLVLEILVKTDKVEAAWIAVEVAGGSKTIEYPTVYSNGKYRFSVAFAAKKIGESAVFTYNAVADGVQYVGETQERSIVNYYEKAYAVYAPLVDANVSGNQAPAFIKFLNAMLNYGAAAQSYFDYKTDALVNANIANEADRTAFESYTKDSAAATAVATIKEDCKNAVYTLVGQSAVLADRVESVLEFTGTGYDASAVVFKGSYKDINDNTKSFECDVVATEAGVKVYISEVAAKDLRQTVTGALYANGQQVSNSVSFSFETYVTGVYAGNNTALQSICAATLIYSDAAKELFTFDMRPLAENIVKEADKVLKVFDVASSEYKAQHSTEHTKSAAVSVRWSFGEKVTWNVANQKDLSEYKTLTLSLYADAAAVGETFMLCFISENNATSGMDYYGIRITVGKKGWNDYVFSLADFSVNRTPIGWHSVSELRLASTGWDQTNNTTTVLYLDNIELHTSSNVSEGSDVLKVFDVASNDYKEQHSTEHTKSEDVSVRWCFGEKASWSIATPKDLSNYKTLTLSLYADAAAIGETFILYFVSENDATRGMDYYGIRITVGKKGWNDYVFSLADLSVNRTPIGWHSVSELRLASTGWDQTNNTTTVLYLDNIELHTGSSVSILKSMGNAAAFSIGGTRALVGGDTVNISRLNENAAAFEEDGTLWLPIAPLAAVKDSGSRYSAKSKLLSMKLNGKNYQFVGGRSTVKIDGSDEKLDFEIRVMEDTLFVPAEYLSELFGYSEIYRDEMGVVILSNTKNIFNLDKDLDTLLAVAYETLFIRPSGKEIIADMKANTGDNVHPRIMLKADDFERLETLAAEDSEYRALLAELIKKYDENSAEYKDAPVEWELTDGVRLLYISREAKNRIIPWAFLYRVTGREIYANRAWADLEALCDFKDWHPEHFLDTAEICYAIAIGYDWLYDYLDASQKNKMEVAVLNMGIIPGLESYEGKRTIWGDNNWNGVCNGGLVSVALAFADVYPNQCEKILGYAITDVERGMYSYAPDGGYLESPGYWSYGTDYLHVMMSSLYSACGTTYGLYNSPGFSESAYFASHFENEVGSWGFHDAGSGQIETQCLSWFAKMSSDPSLNRLRRNGIDEKLKPVHVYDLMWYDPENICDTVVLPKDSYYSHVGSVTMRSSWDKGAILMGLHGGANNASHWDLDMGNFILYAAGKPFFIDLGGDDYNIPGYFGAKRANYYKKRAEGQNTLVIGDVSYTVPDQEKAAVGKFTRVENNEDTSIAVLDMSSAYKTVQQGKRGMLFTDERSTIIIQDEFKLTGAQTVRWSAHTRGNISITEGGRVACITLGDVTLYCEIVSENKELVFSYSDAVSFDESYPVTEGEHSRAGIRKLMIISPEKVSEWNVAVVCRVVKNGQQLPALGTEYQWQNMQDWELK